MFGERTAEMARRQGSIVFFSCSPGEYSCELGSLSGGHGVFSHAMISALGQGLGNPIELDDFISREVREICAENNLAEQRPYTTVAPVQKAVLDIFDGSVRIGLRPSNMILIVGPSNAGKTTLGRYIAGTYGYTHVEMSSFAWSRFGSEPTYNGSLQDYLEDVEWSPGKEDVLAQDMLEASRGLQNVVVCGPRRSEEVETIVSSGWNVIPIYLYANSLIRFERLKAADASSRYGINYRDFVRKDLKEYSWGLAKIAQMARFEILLGADSVEAVQAGLVSQVRRFGLTLSPATGNRR